MVTTYANFLSSTNRSAQALAMLKEVQARSPRMSAWDEPNLFSAMANCARGLGDTEQTAKYEALIRAKQTAGPDMLVDVPLPDDLFQKAESAANEGRLDEAFALATRALDAAGRSENRDEIGVQIPSTAAVMASEGGARAAERLLQSAILLAEDWADDRGQL